ncbi:MAG: NADH dehydrogenase subunit K [Cyanobacteria bacterium]|nr:NADH dehydrogenase subunit K [Cyanobacteria bacterium bin.51]
MTITPSTTNPLAAPGLAAPSIDALRDLRAASCNPVGAPTVTSDLSENVILTSLDDLHNWARLSSLWPLLYGTACCFIEFAALLGSRFDFDRFGLVPRSSPRQADLLITAGTVTMKMAPALVRLYEQMPEPKYVIAMGACTITGGMFSADSTTAVRGVDKLIPVDLYIPGCPPRPEAIFDAVIKLRKKVGNEALAERANLLPSHRYLTIEHQLKPVAPIVTGAYLKAETQKAALAAADGLPMAAADSVTSSEPVPASSTSNDV